MTDTEDRNIATLREFLTRYSRDNEALSSVSDPRLEDAFSAVSALASSLAERDRRIAELTEANAEVIAYSKEERAAAGEFMAENDSLRERIRALEAPPAPAPGELPQHIALVSGVLNEFRAASVVLPRDAVSALLSSAESWQRLQWRPASEAPEVKRLLLRLKRGTLAEGHRLHCGTWVAVGIQRDIYPEEVLGFISLDALPALNGGDDNG